MPPLIDADDTVVNTPALRRLEPYLSDVVAEVGSVGAFLDKVAPTSLTDGNASVSNVCGAMNSAARVNSAGIMKGAAWSIRSMATRVEQVFSAIVETRQRYEQTEHDNTVSVADIFTATDSGAPVPADTIGVGVSPLDSSTPLLPQLDDPASFLGDPTRAGQDTVEGALGALTSLGEPRSALGKVLAAAEISPRLVAGKVVQWGGGNWTETLTAAQGFGQAARAVAVLRTKVEAGFDYVALVWRSRAFEAAHVTFNQVLIELDDLIETLATCAQFEANTAAALAEIDAALVGHLPAIVTDYQSFLNQDSEMGQVSAPPGVSTVIVAGMSAELTRRMLVFNGSYLALCDYCETALPQLIDLRRQYMAFGQQRGVCAEGGQSYPEPVPRF